jgi:hypothetical protein
MQLGSGLANRPFPWFEELRVRQSEITAAQNLSFLLRFVRGSQLKNSADSWLRESKMT